MGIFDRLFGSGGTDKGAEEPIPALPWERKPSIYEHVETHVQAGKLVDDGQDLPDEEQTFAGSQIRWAAGAMDGVATHHMGGSDGDGATALLNVVGDYCKAPSVENKLKVYERIMQTRTVGVIDPFIQELRQTSDINFNRLYELAKSFAIEATDREPVKLGIALLGLFREDQDRELFRTLGRHDEFTLFCAVALANGEGDPEQELWELAKSVHGWGRVHIVERLAKTEDPAIKDWLLREGYKNSVMYEYLAYTCATGGGLLSALERENVDAELLASSGDIIKALLSGGPAEDIDTYDDGAAVIEHYLNHLRARATSIPDLLGVAAVRSFLANAEADWEGRSSRGWTPELRASLLEQCNKAIEQPLWRQLVLKGLESSDEQAFHLANQAASILGIDTWEYHWKRLQAEPTDSGRWFHTMQCSGPEHVGAVVDFAMRALPLTAIAKGPAQELGMGKEFQPHQCLGSVLQGLQAFPGYGVRLIEVGLKSPVVSNRNGALRALAAWGKMNWPQGMEATLAETMAQEPEKKVRESIQKVIDGEALD